MTQVLPIVFMVLASGCLLIAIVGTWLSLRGLFGGDEAEALSQTEASRRYAELLDEKAALLRSIKDLEFEREVGKLSEADFDRLNKQFRRRAKQILRELDRDLGPHREEAGKLLAEFIPAEEQEAKS